MRIYVEELNATVDVPDDFTDEEIKSLDLSQFTQADRESVGVIEEYKPNLYEKHVKPVLQELGLVDKPLIAGEPAAYAFIGKAIERGTFGNFSSKAFDKSYQEHPIAATAGAIAGEVGSFMATSVGLGAAGVPAKLGMMKSILAESSPILARYLPTALWRAGTFGTKTFIEETIKASKEGEIDLPKLSNAVSKDFGLGLLWGALGANPNRLKAMSGASALGFLYAKSEGATNAEAGITATIFGLVEGIDTIGRDTRMRKQAIETIGDSLGQYAKTKRPDLSGEQANNIGKAFLNQQIKKAGGLTKIIKDKSNTLAFLEKVNQQILKASKGLNQKQTPMPVVVKPKAKQAKQFLSAPKENIIPSSEQSLIQEAKKYKTAEEFKALGFDEILKDLKGVERDTIVIIPTDKVEIKWKDDYTHALDTAKGEYNPETAPPVDLIYDFKKDKYILDDGHNRFVSAQRNNQPIKGTIQQIEGNLEELADLYAKEKGVSITDIWKQANKPTTQDPLIEEGKNIWSRKEIEKATGEGSLAILKNATLEKIPIDKITGREDTQDRIPVSKRNIDTVIEVMPNEEGGYDLLNGNHRILQAIENGDTTIEAFVDAEDKVKQLTDIWKQAQDSAVENIFKTDDEATPLAVTNYQEAKELAKRFGGKTVRVGNEQVWYIESKQTKDEFLPENYTDIWKQANKPTTQDPLIEEAKKYKTAQEFVESKFGKGVQFAKVDSLDIYETEINRELVDEIKKQIQGGDFVGALKHREAIGNSPAIRVEDGRVIDGNHRLIALKELGIKEAPVEIIGSSLNVDLTLPKQLTDIWNEAHGEADITEPQKLEQSKIKPIVTKGKLDKLKQEKEMLDKQINLEKASKGKSALIDSVRKRRLNLNERNYNTELFINKNISTKLSKEEREIIPFIIEKTDVPTALGRPDLEKVFDDKAEDLKPVAEKIGEHFDKGFKEYKEQIGNMAQDKIEDYVTHIFEIPKGKVSEVSAWFSTQSRFAKKRFIQTYKEGIEKFGLKPKTLDIAEIIRIHDSAGNKAIENRKFLDTLMASKENDIPLVARIDKAPKHWVLFDHPALRKGMVVPGEKKLGERISDEMVDILNQMGVAIGRRIAPTAFGKPRPSGLYFGGERKEIQLQRFFKSSTLAHEIGHHLDEALELGDAFVDKYKDEIFNLNKERIEKLTKIYGVEGRYGKKYAESTEEKIAELFAHLFTNPQKAYQLAPNATVDVLERLKKDEVLSQLVDFDFENNAKLLIEEQLSKLVKLPIKVHPDLVKPLKTIFDSRISHPAIQAYEAINGVLKKTQLSLSLFHHTALAETGIATMGFKKTLGIAFNFPKIYKALAKGEYDVFKKEELALDAIKAGVQLGPTADIPVNKIQGALNEFAKNTANVPIVKQLTKLLAVGNEKWDKALWNYYHDSLKLFAYEHLVGGIDYSKNVTLQKREIAQLINDTFGGQNWDMLMVSPKTLQIASWSLLSPDWTISTIRQALSPTGAGAIYEQTKNLRAKSGQRFWIRAALSIGVGIQLLNSAIRRKDQKDNPELYPKDMSLFDYTMVGNAIGHKTHLFYGRDKDGKEIYLRIGKQFRELPELFFDDTGFSPISATLKKVGGKMSPSLQKLAVWFTGHTLSGYRIRDIADKKGWEKVWGITKDLIKTPLPMSVSSLTYQDKDFIITDLAFPSSKGMSRYKGIELFKTGIERKDERLIKEVWQDLEQNKISPYPLFKGALTILKAQNTEEVQGKLDTIKQIDKELEKSLDTRTKAILMRKKKRLMKEQIQLSKGSLLLDRALKELEIYDNQINNGGKE